MPKTPKIYTFTVSGFGLFPIDMLRYDQCWPTSEFDSGQIDEHHKQRRVDVSSIRSQLTVARWDSFNWKVEGAS